MLEIKGTEMDDYKKIDEVPWNGKRNSIKEIVIEEGITTIGSYVFSYLSNLEKVEHKGSIITYGNNLFENTYSIVIVPNDFKQTDFCELSIVKWNTERLEALAEGHCGEQCHFRLDIISGEMIIKGNGKNRRLHYRKSTMEFIQKWNQRIHNF